jgi:DNA-binding MarR family transcriptional regulator
MKNYEIRQTTHEIFILGAVIAKTTIHSAKKRGFMAEEGLTMLQYGVLKALHNKSLTISELSNFMMVDPSTLVYVIDTLSRKGLAKRRRDPDDRRKVQVHITQKGISIVESHPTHGPFSVEDNPLVQSIEALGEEKAQQLLNLLREVVSHMPEGEDILNHVKNRVQLHATGELTVNSPNQIQES